MTEKEAGKLQLIYSRQIEEEGIQLEDIRVVAGCDVEYEKDSDNIAGALVLLDRKTKAVLEAATHTMKANFPYIPGLFSFREMPILLEAFKRLKTRPDIIICDGQGLAHPRSFGLACHLGIELNLPTIGCAKTRLFGNYVSPGPNRGDHSDLLHEETGRIIGRVLRTQNNINPVFVSVGHKISLETASQLVLEFANTYRLPETTRLSDKFAREALLAAR